MCRHLLERVVYIRYFLGILLRSRTNLVGIKFHGVISPTHCLHTCSHEACLVGRSSHMLASHVCITWTALLLLVFISSLGL